MTFEWFRSHRKLLSYSLNTLYKVMRISKQAVHQHRKRKEQFTKNVVNLLAEVDTIRDTHGGCGISKMYKTLKPTFIGRDKFISTLKEYGYRIRTPRQYHTTTIPVHSKYSNLIKGVEVNKTNQIWQSDITYYDIGDTYCYISLITDVYSRKIVGYNVSSSLRAESNIKALKKSLSKRSAPDIHHSDRGSQYTDKRYIKLLESSGSQISMGNKAQDNAYVERLNSTLKNEYLKYWKITNIEKLRRKVRIAVEHYNNHRLHSSLTSDMPPSKFEEYIKTLGSHQMPKMTIYDDDRGGSKAA